MLWLLILIAAAFLPAWLAERKGYSYFWFYGFGLLLWPVAMIVVLLLRTRKRTVA